MRFVHYTCSFLLLITHSWATENVQQGNDVHATIPHIRTMDLLTGDLSMMADEHEFTHGISMSDNDNILCIYDNHPDEGYEISISGCYGAYCSQNGLFMQEEHASGVNDRIAYGVEFKTAGGGYVHLDEFVSNLDIYDVQIPSDALCNLPIEQSHFSVVVSPEEIASSMAGLYLGTLTIKVSDI